MEEGRGRISAEAEQGVSVRAMGACHFFAGGGHVLGHTAIWIGDGYLSLSLSLPLAEPRARCPFVVSVLELPTILTPALWYTAARKTGLDIWYIPTHGILCFKRMEPHAKSNDKPFSCIDCVSR